MDQLSRPVRIVRLDDRRLVELHLCPLGKCRAERQELLLVVYGRSDSDGPSGRQHTDDVNSIAAASPEFPRWPAAMA